MQAVKPFKFMVRTEVVSLLPHYERTRRTRTRAADPVEERLAGPCCVLTPGCLEAGFHHGWQWFGRADGDQHSSDKQQFPQLASSNSQKWATPIPGPSQLRILESQISFWQLVVHHPFIATAHAASSDSSHLLDLEIARETPKYASYSRRRIGCR